MSSADNIANVRNYQIQLQQVETALAAEPDNEEMKILKKDLEVCSSSSSSLYHSSNNNPSSPSSSGGNRPDDERDGAGRAGDAEEQHLQLSFSCRVLRFKSQLQGRGLRPGALERRRTVST